MHVVPEPLEVLFQFRQYARDNGLFLRTNACNARRCFDCRLGDGSEFQITIVQSHY